MISYGISVHPTGSRPFWLKVEPGKTQRWYLNELVRGFSFKWVKTCVSLIRTSQRSKVIQFFVVGLWVWPWRALNEAAILTGTNLNKNLNKIFRVSRID